MALAEGEAVQVASFRNNRILIDTTSFGKILDKVGDRPLAIISVNGPMRTGKSYLLGHMLRFLGTPRGQDWFTVRLRHEFHWINSSERQTTGILAWSEPFLVQQRGKEVAVLLLDTQGCFDDKTTTNENSLIFALSCLLSSTLVYNIKNVLSEDVLQFLQLFIGYAKMSTEQEEAETFSKLVFLIRDWASPRDFAFGYHDHVTAAGGRNFKREKVDLQPDMPPEVQVVHREILSSFASVGCCLMPYPGNGLAIDDKIDQLEADFVQVIRDLLPRLLDGEQATLKRLGGHEVTGRELKPILEKWAEMFASQEIPPVRNMAESTAEIQNRIASSIALKFYEGEMQQVKSGSGLPDAQLEQLHRSKRQEAMDMFKRMKRIAHAGIQETFRKMLEEDIDRAFQAYAEINRTLRQFQEFKVESEQEREQLRADMEERIRQIEREARKKSGGFFSQIGGFLGDCLDVATKVLKLKEVFTGLGGLMK